MKNGFKKIFSLFVFFFAFFSLFNSADARIVKFIQITDVHFKRQKPENLEAFVKEVNKNHSGIDFVVFTGDNVNSADGADLYRFLKEVKKINKKTYIVLGNHDLSEVKSMTSQNYLYMTRKILGRYHSSKPNYIFKKGDVVFIVMNGVKEYFSSSSGYFKKTELDWLDGNLKKYKNNKVVILQHFPIINSKDEAANLWKKDDYQKVIEKHNNIIAIISGHYHQNSEVIVNGIYNIITLDFKDHNCYKIIEIDDNTGKIYTSLIK